METTQELLPVLESLVMLDFLRGIDLHFLCIYPYSISIQLAIYLFFQTICCTRVLVAAVKKIYCEEEKNIYKSSHPSLLRHPAQIGLGFVGCVQQICWSGYRVRGNRYIY